MYNEIFIHWPSGRLVNRKGAAADFLPAFGDEDYSLVRLTVRDDCLRPVDLSQALSWEAALDIDFDPDTPVMAKTLPEYFDLSRAAEGLLDFPVDCRTSTYRKKTGSNGGQQATLELYGYQAGGKKWPRFRIPCVAQAIVDSGEPPGPPPDGCATQAWVLALLNSGMALQYSTDGETWLDVPPEHPVIPDAARWYRFRIRGTDAEWSAAIPIPHGAKGDSPRGVYFTPLQDDVERNTTCCWLNATDPEMNSPGLLASVSGLRAVTAVTDAAATGDAVVEVLLNGVSFTTVIIAATAELAAFAVDFATPVSAVITLKRLLDDERDTLAPEVPLVFYDLEVLK